MLLQTEHVSKAFNGIYALRDIDFSLEAGEIPLLVDPEGKMISHLKPWAVVDAIIAKKNMGTA